MALRCSVCGQWIKTSGGTHECPGSSDDRTPNVRSYLGGNSDCDVPMPQWASTAYFGPSNYTECISEELAKTEYANSLI